ncbi:hypothetical protein [Streptomyces sp. NRRL S-455]|uniref:beta barrel domain-containing protein n=1 Tax=Streptomyces sp. NRRL S-455 TaxID=1463908 RepID=UPI0004BE6E11|nr:hypothetical protein [Streptomyces sp. NRRL S-455]
MTRNGLPQLGDVNPGDELVVIDDPSSRNLRTVRVRVTKVAPVWIDVESVDGSRLSESRFRRDNQSAKAKPEHWTACFYTLEQWAWKERNARAHRYLREIGVSADLGSRFSGDPLTLANVIRRGLGEAEL